MPVLPFRGIWPRIADNVFIAPGAYIIGDVTIGEGASIWYNSVVRGDTGPIVIGRRTNIQDNCVLHLDADAPLTIGEECTIGHGCIIHGATLGDRVLLGMKAVVLNRARIGAETIIGACALVSEGKTLPGGVLAFGLPARVVRNLTPEEIEDIRGSAQRYVERAAHHREALREAGLQPESFPDR
ncbi:gamma carbonic anhydrase family protein [Thermogemmatispora sp.]|uniref:gamma carbonic anhydrase family protein n=1 Tax=Thermogemmatispora sp. TaxID=1968838 RepID=UPI0035E446F5